VTDRPTAFRYDLPRPGLIGVLLLMMLTAACAGSGRSTINLMPAPAIFAGGGINPLPKGPPPVSYDDFQMLYASDRKPFDNMGKGSSVCSLSILFIPHASSFSVSVLTDDTDPFLDNDNLSR
jgi:hypothetical protein